MTRHRWWVTGVALSVGALSASALEAQRTTLTGEVRPRMESRDPSGGGADTFTSMRVRLGLHAAIDDNLSIFIQAQDVRIWGEETHPLFDYRADNIDLHQGYFRYQGAELDWLTATVGRMEANLGGQRLVGPVDWTQQGQAFDGFRVDLDGEPGSVALLAYTIADLSAIPASENRQLWGAYASRGEVGPGDLELYWLYGRTTSAAETDEHSIGARYVVGGDITGRVEATYQTGTRAGSDVSAFMFGARIGSDFADGQVGATLWYDYLSGDDPSTPEVEVFNTLYATNHKFYGLADIFLNIPAHTGGAGLQDLAAKFDFDLGEDVSANVDVHTFRASKQGSLSGTHLADELDITVAHRYSANLTATAGFSYIVQDDPLGEIGRLSGNLKWFYVMFRAGF